MTRESGLEIGGKIGRVLDVDVPEKGVQWGKYLRVRVSVDAMKKLVRGKKVTIKGGEAKWVFFKYERLPNFCYQCGRLDHGVKECKEKASTENRAGDEGMQYGAWLRGEPGRRGGWEQGRMGDENDGEGRGLPQVISNLTPKEKVGVPPLLPVADLEGDMVWEISKNEDAREKTKGVLDKKHTCKDLGKDSGLESSAVGSWADDNSSPLAMTFNQEKGWVTEPLGPTSGHWKRLARKIKTPSPNKVDCTSKTKHKGPIPLQELDPNNISSKRRKGKLQVSKVTDENGNMVGGEAVAAVQHRQAS
ncbi:uncharacterized protein LOC115985247 [Quercus lobata]|uniref:uncharacterized protein LOC115985247 n=1 Tax=Quercus lobata TaxID=97700 RepID=UPI00124749DE|nr:uncharacterized protein LOC115985247 [Quercus lobata]